MGTMSGVRVDRTQLRMAARAVEPMAGRTGLDPAPPGIPTPSGVRSRGGGSLAPVMSGWSTIPTHCPGRMDSRCSQKCVINPETGVIREPHCFVVRSEGDAE